MDSPQRVHCPLHTRHKLVQFEYSQYFYCPICRNWFQFCAYGRKAGFRPL
jgi:hypothetical protein